MVGEVVIKTTCDNAGGGGMDVGGRLNHTLTLSTYSTNCGLYQTEIMLLFIRLFGYLPFLKGDKSGVRCENWTSRSFDLI